MEETSLSLSTVGRKGSQGKQQGEGTQRQAGETQRRGWQGGGRQAKYQQMGNYRLLVETRTARGKLAPQKTDKFKKNKLRNSAGMRAYDKGVQSKKQGFLQYANKFSKGEQNKV